MHAANYGGKINSCKGHGVSDLGGKRTQQIMTKKNHFMQSVYVEYTIALRLSELAEVYVSCDNMGYF